MGIHGVEEAETTTGNWPMAITWTSGGRVNKGLVAVGIANVVKMAKISILNSQRQSEQHIH